MKNDSLISIKGISKKLAVLLNVLNLYSAFDLLVRGRTVAARKELVEDINKKLANVPDDQKITLQQVESWIRQCDLKRIYGMTDDMAFLLSLIGIRGIEDLAQINPETTANVLLSVQASQLDDFSMTTDFKSLIEELRRFAETAAMMQPDSISSGKRLGHVFRIELSGVSPVYLFDTGSLSADEEKENAIKNFYNIYDGLNTLQNIPDVPALPGKVEGHVKLMFEDDHSTKNLACAHVELIGIASPNTNIEDVCTNPVAYTDSNGNFVIDMPDNYNLSSKLTFRFTKGDSAHDEPYDATDLLENTRKGRRLEFTLSSSDIKPVQHSNKGALPSVKLMGEGNAAVHLNTDTMPSRVFKYCFLQRLLAPTINKEGNRSMLNKPVDIDGFKDDFKTPETIQSASSLGLGYILNMHQAWAPDGFALGSMLYSTVLAPGEEQRLVVRERTENYTVKDVMTGSDNVSDTAEISQQDDARAIFNDAADRYSNAGSNYRAHSSTRSNGDSVSVFGIWGHSHSSSSSDSSGNANASQYDSFNEASSAAQEFQYRIKSESERNVIAHRMSIRSATSEEKDSVATKIIANHNHSHVLTVQYWEVMRRYKLETCIENVNLVLFIPMKLINFTGVSSYVTDCNSFISKYSKLNKYYDVLKLNVPREHRSALETVKNFSAKTTFDIQQKEERISSLTLNFDTYLLPFDQVRITLRLRGGMCVIGTPTKDYHQDLEINQVQSHADYYRELQKQRYVNTPVSYSWKFVLPDVLPSEILQIEIAHSFDDNFCYTLQFDASKLTEAQNKAYEKFLEELYDYSKNNKQSDKEVVNMKHYAGLLPDACLSPNRSLSSYELSKLGYPEIGNASIKCEYTSESQQKVNSNLLYVNLSTNKLRGTVYCNVTYRHNPYISLIELEKVEALYQHVQNNLVHYSQCVWNSLSTNELILLLEPYTIDMPFKNQGRIQTNVPLLNCVDVYRPIGYYGDCLLLPFVIPQELSEQLEEQMQKDQNGGIKSSKDLQDRLYKFHVRNFRVPTTTISLPTEGMVGEAVLGETNISEKIDLTRFWNWKDSEIDHMAITKDDLNTDSLLKGVAPGTLAMPTTGAVLPEYKAADILSKLLNRASPTWNDLSDQTDMRGLMSKMDDNTTKGRDKVLDINKGMIDKTLDMISTILPAVEQGIMGLTTQSNVMSLLGGESKDGKPNLLTMLQQKPELAAMLPDLSNFISSLKGNSPAPNVGGAAGKGNASAKPAGKPEAKADSKS